MDDHLERRYGKRVAYKGRYHDAVRSTKDQVVTTPGIRWLCLAACLPVPWSRRPWTLPFLILPTRSPALSAAMHKPRRTISEQAAVTVRLLRRWLPTRKLVVVGDNTYGVAPVSWTPCSKPPVTRPDYHQMAKAEGYRHCWRIHSVGAIPCGCPNP